MKGLYVEPIKPQHNERLYRIYTTNPLDELYFIREHNDIDDLELEATVKCKMRIRFGKRSTPTLLAIDDVTDLFYDDNNADQWG